MNMLEINNLKAGIGDTEILTGLSLSVKPGEVHAIMGPNGSGKSTLAQVIAGNDDYAVYDGTVAFLGENLLDLEPEERARRGIFLGFQYPVEIPGVNNAYLLKAAVNAKRKHEGLEEVDAFEFLKLARETMAMLDMDPSFLKRGVNEGFSGGEKKRNEILQMAILKPRLAILDETDSGLDIDALKAVANGVNSLRDPERSIVLGGERLRLGSGGRQRMSGTGLQQELLEAAVTALPTDELSAVRRTAVASLAANGFPTTKHEDWKYTNLSAAAALSNTWLQDQKAVSKAKSGAVDTEILGQIDAYWITIENGIIDPRSLRELDSLTKDGVTISRLADGVDESLITLDDPMSAFNAALLQDGLHIKAANGATLDKPVGLLFIDDGSVAVTQLRTNAVTQVVLSDNAELDFVRLQQRDRNDLNVNRFEAKLQRDSVLNYNNFDFGGELARNDIVADIVGTGASVHLRGLYLATGTQHIDNHTRVDHRVGPATSTEEYRGILNGRARCVFNGKAIVHAGADGTDADQSNHNLLLSEKAEIDTKPELEIYADDVKCSHGATVGQLDKSALFYLRARGLDKDDATQALTRAFASAILSKLAIAECHEYLASAMDRQLDALIDEE
jgi:FeS assembly ATPase SufC/FeS assembly protein SufD